MRGLLYLLFVSPVLIILGTLSVGGAQVDDCRVEALRQLEAAADSGMPRACFQLARLLESGDEGILVPDTARALALYAQAADSAYPPALNYLGFIRFHGLLGTRPDTAAAVSLIESAAMLGDATAASNLGWLLSQPGTSVRHDADKAIYWLRKSAQSGSYLPLEAIADIYLQRGDTAIGVQYLDSAVMRGAPHTPHRLLALRRTDYAAMPADALMNEALQYYHGGSPLMGVLLMEELTDRADASRADRALAAAILAQLTSQGHILRYDYDRAMRLFLEAAQLGDPSAQFIIAETLDITPDAFPDAGFIKDKTAQDLRESAAAAGVKDSGEALSRLLP